MGTITNLTKVAEKSKTHNVQRHEDHYLVTSGTSGAVYHVRLTPLARCTCQWAVKGRGHKSACACSHVQAVVSWVAENRRGYKAIARPATDDVAHLHRKVYQLGDNVQFTMRKMEA
jgi:hypothetical protein